MSDIAIRVDKLGKRYKLGQKEPYKTLRDAILNVASLPVKSFKSRINSNGGDESAQYFWALKDVSFEVEQGDVIGVIGRNGAGKSTLLKILSRITTPTEGTVEYNGRIGSLLEVGTGFHPELTGYENIFLSGSILGMKKREIEDKLEEIVKFAEVEKFLDTPAKRYSSGMYVRLAFAVAAHLDPEILLVDEVLAVGDSGFQKKCLGKMGQVANEGRTVLFVSHNMAAVQNLCGKGVVLDCGKISFIGDIGDAIDKYLGSAASNRTTNILERTDRKGSQILKFTDVIILNSKSEKLDFVQSGQDIFIKLYFKSLCCFKDASILVSFNIRTNFGQILSNLNSIDTGDDRLEIYENGFFECFWPKFNLKGGVYECNLFCSINGEISDWMQNAFIINVVDGDYFGSGKVIDKSQGNIIISHSWKSFRLD
jgi:lipopolysaccharide transport system ATP-binding protein